MGNNEDDWHRSVYSALLIYWSKIGLSKAKVTSTITDQLSIMQQANKNCKQNIEEEKEKPFNLIEKEHDKIKFHFRDDNGRAIFSLQHP